MNFLIVHNEYSQRGGEESVVELQKHLLEQKGHTVTLYTRNYNEMQSNARGKILSIFTSVYNPKSIKDIKNIVTTHKIEIAIIHNVYSIISPAIIPVLKKNNVKVWQIVHNYRLFCPIGIFFNKGKICEKCLLKTRELHCVIDNCLNNKVRSFAFALKFFVIRKLNYYKSADRFYFLSHFQKNKFIQNGIPKNKAFYLPNTFVPINNAYIQEDTTKKIHIGFVGRLTKEKGFFDFADLAKQMPNYNFVVAGSVTQEIKQMTLPKNITFEGFLNKEGMQDFYNKCRVIMFLSTWYEGFPMVLIESLFYKTPLIVNNLSVMAEVVQDNQTGFVLNNKDKEIIKQKIDSLFDNTEVYQKMRENCGVQFFEKYSSDKYYQRLLQE